MSPTRDQFPESLRSFVAVDFETAQKRRASPIQIGVVRVIDGVIGRPFTVPVMPPPGYRDFDPELTAVHGLTPDYIRGAAEWPDILDRLVRFSEGMPLVAHNAVFERSVIRQTSEVYGLPDPGFEYRCTWRMAQKLLPKPTVLPNHKLPTLAAHFGLTQLAHHDAGDDAVVCANLALELLAEEAGDRAFEACRLR